MKFTTALQKLSKLAMAAGIKIDHQKNDKDNRSLRSVESDRRSTKLDPICLGHNKKAN